MPQLTKLRIVNFSYNNGHRLIPDMTFSFSGEDGKALNTFLHLTNGGGKTVLVQLMMQPILPKTTLSERKIESYFEKAGDHCFVLLEWKLDDSQQRLLTGIALAAGESTLSDAGEDGTRKGVTVKYYTFVNDYGTFGDPYDVEQLELSVRQEHKFQAKPFEYVRELAKKKAGKLKCYSVDNQPEYRKLLASYGISALEWRNVIGRVNRVESGMVKYFEEFATGNALIDRLLIPCVEEGLAAGRTDAGGQREDSSLETMLLDYADEYEKKAQNAQNREAAVDFQQALKERQPEIAGLYNLNDRLEQETGRLLGFFAAVQAKKAELEKELEQITEELAACEKDELRLNLEIASQGYYQKEQTRQQADETLQAMGEALAKLQQEKRTLEHRKAVLECARRYAGMQEDRGTIEGLRKKIAAMTGEKNLQEEIGRLRYTISQKAGEQFKAEAETLCTLTVQQKETDTAWTSCAAQQQKAEEQRKQADDESNQQNGMLKMRRGDLEASAQRLGIELEWMLGNELDASQMELCRSKTEKDKKENETQLSALAKRQEALKEDAKELQKAEMALQERMRSEKTALEALQRDFKAYKTAEDSLRIVFERYSLNFGQRFTAEPRQTLEQMQAELQADKTCNERLQYALEEQLEAVRQGSLHVPKAVMEYLKTSHISRFETCEQYLRDCELSAPQVCALLERYPALAYGVIMPKEDAQRLQNESRADWLPSMVPIYQTEDIERMLQNRLPPSSRAIAFYSKAYFEDGAHYREKLAERQRQAEETITLQKQQLEALAESLSELSAFSYSAAWAQEQTERLKKQEDAIQCLNEQITECRDRQDSCTRSMADAQEKLRECEQMSIAIRNWFDGYEQMEHFLRDYREAQKQLAEQQERLYQLVRQIEALARTKAELEEKKTDLKRKIEGCESRAEALRGYLEKVRDAKPTETLSEGEVDTLYTQLTELEKKLGDDVEPLLNQINRLENSIRRISDEIQQDNLAEEEYRNVRAEPQEEENVRKRLKEMVGQEDDANKANLDAAQAAGTAQAECSEALARVKKYAERPLEPQEITGGFAARKTSLAERKKNAQERQSKNGKLRQQITTVEALRKQLREKYTTERILPVELAEDLMQQMDALQNAQGRAQDAFMQEHKSFIKKMRALQTRFNAQPEYARILANEIDLIEQSQNKGNLYYTLSEQVEGHLNILEKQIAQYTIDLKELDARRDELAKQCLRQGELLYTNLKRLMESSRVKLPGRSTAVEMLKLDIPEEVDKIAARTRIEGEVGQAVQEFIAIKAAKSEKSELVAKAKKLVGSRKLLNLYIGQESIPVSVYKIDLNSSNSRYRTWEKTLVENSGGERVVVYFSILVMLMNYSRTAGMTITGRKNGSVLILDNPFGPITSAHLLKPMFEIAHASRVQLICFSNIDNSDVTQCFESLIKILVKQLPLSGSEVLTAESSEYVERAFYRSEQLSLV